jgi:hypothetical protein
MRLLRRSSAQGRLPALPLEMRLTPTQHEEPGPKRRAWSPHAIHLEEESPEFPHPSSFSEEEPWPPRWHSLLSSSFLLVLWQA